MDAPAPSGRKIKVKPSSGCPLPEEIVEDILSRLPARSPCRFQCVSRSFRAAISSRAFQDTHCQRHSGGRRRLFIRPAGVQEPFYAWRPGSGGPAVVETIMSARRLPQASILPASNKSCRGLVLLGNADYSTHHVWNPSTGEMLTLPDKVPLRVRWSPFLVSYGLGYCSATQRHKVVRVYDANDDGYGATICEVFTLHDSAYWRPVATRRHHQRENYRSQGGVLCNGNVHFLDNYGGVIAVFNVKDETFGTLNTPSELQRQYRASNLELTELGGSLCIYTVVQKEWCYQEPKYLVDVWLLSDYDYDTAAAKWEKLRRIDCRRHQDEGELAMMLKSPRITPLDMYHDDDTASSNSNQQRRKIVFATGACDVFIVDPDTGATKLAFSPKDTAIGECSNVGRPPAVGLFEESLARVGSLSDNTAFASPSMRAWSEVLSRLPARTVWSLDQVCRGWRAIIKSDHFAAAHLHRANLDRPSPQVMFVNVDGTPYTFEPAEKYINKPYLPPVIDSSRTVVTCSRPCHGLNACSFNGYDFVCNPATGYCKALLPPDEKKFKGLYTDPDFVLETICMGLQVRDEDATGGLLGLGYERETSRHVLVRLVYKERNLTTRGYKMVCSMRYLKDMVWDEVDPPPRPIANMPPSHVNGKLYWMVDTELGQRSSSGHIEIVVLDVSTRKFEVLQGPPCADDVDHESVIIELEEMVCVACSHRSTGILEIWAKGHTSGMWSVRYSIELQSFAPEYSPETTMPLALDPKDGRILLSTGRALGYYNPKTAEVETICRLGKHAQGMKFVPVLFQESLVNPCHRSV